MLFSAAETDVIKQQSTPLPPACPPVSLNNSASNGTVTTNLPAQTNAAAPFAPATPDQRSVDNADDKLTSRLFSQSSTAAQQEMKGLAVKGVAVAAAGVGEGLLKALDVWNSTKANRTAKPVTPVPAGNPILYVLL